MAPSIQAQHVVAVTIPTIAVLFLTYLWYKKRSNRITRGRNDPGGGGGTSRKRARHRSMVSTMPSVTVANSVTAEPQETLPQAMRNAMQKAIRDLETASPIQEICSDSEDGAVAADAQSASADTTSAGEVESPIHKKNTVDVGTSIQHAEEYNNNESNNADEVNDSKVGAVSTNEEKTLSSQTECAPPLTSPEGECDGRDDATSTVTDRASEVTCTNERVDQTTTTTGRKHSHVEPVEAASGVKSCRQNATTGSADDDLDLAMQKLESMRLSDKPKCKSNASKRHPAAKEISSMAAAVAAAAAAEVEICGTSPTGKSKLPSSIASQLSSHSSKMKKRKSVKKKNAGSVSGDDVVHNCQSPSETTPEVSVTSTCDFKNSLDPCGRTSPNAKSAFRKCLSENEKILRNSSESDSIRCNLKKTGDYDLKVIEHHQADCDNERDSANHSPVDTMLDSQLVQFSDAHSEGSSDSGKGCSEGAASPTPQTPVGGSSVSGDQNMLILYQFVIPQEHVGKLIGKHGQFINHIKSNSNTKIYIKKHPTSFKKKICAMEGSQQEINKALELIKVRFPEENYPDVTLEEFPVTLPPCPLRSELFQLDLIEGVNNDVVISSVVSAGHLFLQQPMHPTYQALTLLNLNMNQVYSSPEAPAVFKPTKDNIVAAPAMDGWYRAQIVSADDETETCEVRFLDYGGYLTLNTSCLRAVRADFLSLPFQAVECFLANVAPIDETWCEDAKLIVQGLTYGHILQAQVYDYTSDGIPLILLYAVHGSQVILINQELIARGFAYPTIPSEGAQSEEYYCS